MKCLPEPGKSFFFMGLPAMIPLTWQLPVWTSDTHAQPIIMALAFTSLITCFMFTMGNTANTQGRSATKPIVFCCALYSLGITNASITLPQKPLRLSREGRTELAAAFDVAVEQCGWCGLTLLCIRLTLQNILAKARGQIPRRPSLSEGPCEIISL